MEKSKERGIQYKCQDLFILDSHCKHAAGDQAQAREGALHLRLRVQAPRHLQGQGMRPLQVRIQGSDGGGQLRGDQEHHGGGDHGWLGAHALHPAQGVVRCAVQ